MCACTVSGLCVLVQEALSGVAANEYQLICDLDFNHKL